MTKREMMTDPEQFIFNQIACDNSLIQSELKDKVQEQFGTTMSQSTISRKLKKIGLPRKRLSMIPEERNTLERIQARAIYANELINISHDNLVFLDETGFNQHTRRVYGYAPVNQKAYINVPANRNVNRSLMCAITNGGVIAFEWKTRAYNSDSYSFYNYKVSALF